MYCSFSSIKFLQILFNSVQLPVTSKCTTNVIYKRNGCNQNPILILCEYSNSVQFNAFSLISVQLPLFHFDSIYFNLFQAYFNMFVPPVHNKYTPKAVYRRYGSKLYLLIMLNSDSYSVG